MLCIFGAPKFLWEFLGLPSICKRTVGAPAQESLPERDKWIGEAERLLKEK
jgi:hypothetical protein